ncbi:hypothetical protein T07_14644 [Trichinella nelsoni]|uniref:Uncharacterized protein n=1 Tax=Trichinella nelsoni TaxID=6336 RepID=A0A0V0RZ05_9BILA|nr:hypothetical protein T07_14644 [Trichinella nelsoni]
MKGVHAVCGNSLTPKRQGCFRLSGGKRSWRFLPPAEVHTQLLTFCVWQTLVKVRLRYYLPQERDDVNYFCLAWDPCAARTALSRKLHASMQLQPVSHPFQPVDMDVVILMEETRYGNHYILCDLSQFKQFILDVAGGVHSADHAGAHGSYCTD